MRSEGDEQIEKKNEVSMKCSGSKHGKPNVQALQFHDIALTNQRVSDETSSFKRSGSKLTPIEFW